MISYSIKARNNLQQMNQQQQGDSVNGTYEWLLNAGVPFSAFDPVALTVPSLSTKQQNQQRQNQTSRGSPTVGTELQEELLECADEITALFSNPSDSSNGSSAPASPSRPLMGTASNDNCVPNATSYAPAPAGVIIRSSLSSSHTPATGVESSPSSSGVDIKDIHNPFNDFLGDIDDNLWALY
jgi:hypothetical protein